MGERTTDATFPTGWYLVDDGSGLADPDGRLVIDALGTSLTLERDRFAGVRVRDAAGRPRLVDLVAGAVAVWHGHHEPAYRVGPFPELEDRRWTGVRWTGSRIVRTTVANAMRDVVDNAHFEPVHGLRGAETRAEDRGHTLETVSQGVISLRSMGGPPLLAHARLEGRLHGPGVLTYRSTVTIGTQIRMLLFSAVTPVDGERSRLLAGVAVRKLPFPGVNGLVLRSTLAGLLEDYERDAAWWEAGRPRAATAGPVTEEERRLLDLYDRWLARSRLAEAA